MQTEMHPRISSQQSFRRQIFSLFAVLMSLLWPNAAFSQSSAAPSAGQTGSASSLTKPETSSSGAIPGDTGQSTTMPLADQYQTFFAWTIHLDEAAAEHEQRGEDGSWLRNHLVESLGISQAEADLVRLAAHRNQTETKASNGRIFSAIMAHRAKSPNDPLPPEIEDMLQQRAAATMRVVSELEEKLGPETSAKIESWRENHLGANRQTIVQRPLPPAAVNAWKEFSTQQVDNIKERIRDRQQQIQRSGEPQGTPEVNQ